ncbi:hypothetical protein [Methanobacterium sp.]|uniref:hypothetical protein n=1 Tax=Methanobacterium sp. TaxID=2164 RepID=UPI003C7259B3
MTISILLIVFAVFSIAAAAESQNQSKSQISSSFIAPQINAISNPVSNSTNSTPRNASLNQTNCTLPPVGQVSNQTLNCTTGTNQSSNQTLNNSAIRDIIGQLLAPVLNDTTNLTDTNATGQPFNKLLTDINTLLGKIGQLLVIIRSGGV